jgi:hypothetical protein
MREEQATEPAILDSFLTQIKPKHPRYKYLGNLLNRAPLDLTNNLGTLNFYRVVRLMAAENEILQAYFPALGSADSCLAGLKTLSYFQWARQQPVPFYEGNQTSFEQPNWIISSVFEPLGVDTSDWSMDFRTRGRLGFTDRFTVPSVPFQLYYNAFHSRFPKADGFALDCAQMRADLSTRLQDFFARGRNIELAARRQILQADPLRTLNACASCHTNDTTGAVPKIDFLNPIMLKAKLADSGYKRGTLLDEIVYRISDFAPQREQMPPPAPLASGERAALEAYLRDLAAH